MIDHVFVYGTLLPGDVRWPHLQRFAADDGVADSVAGALFDTGLDYPAAVFDGSRTIVGRTYRIEPDLLDECLAVLDVEEDTVGGRYRRVPLVTDGGHEVWAYEYGSGLEVRLIESGDWLAHRPAHLAVALTDD